MRSAPFITSLIIFIDYSLLLVDSFDCPLEQACAHGVHPQEEGREGQVQAAPGPGTSSHFVRLTHVSCFGSGSQYPVSLSPGFS